MSGPCTFVFVRRYCGVQVVCNAHTQVLLSRKLVSKFRVSDVLFLPLALVYICDRCERATNGGRAHSVSVPN